MPTIEDLKTALVLAHKEGNYVDAEKIADWIKHAQKDPKNLIPGSKIAELYPPEKLQIPGFIDRNIASLETALAIGTGATTGMVADLGAKMGIIAGQVEEGKFGRPGVDELMDRGISEAVSKFTYQPKTKLGQETTAAVGGAIRDVGLAAMMPTRAVPIASNLGRPSMEQIAGPGKKIPQAATEFKPELEPKFAEAPPGLGGEIIKDQAGEVKVGDQIPLLESGEKSSAGAMQFQTEAQRLQESAKKIGLELTDEESRTGSVRAGIMAEWAKRDDAIGKVIRDASSEKHQKVSAAFGDLADSIGAQPSIPRIAGEEITQTLHREVTKSKALADEKFKSAREMPEANNQVSTGFLRDFFKEGEPVMDTVELFGILEKKLKQKKAIVDLTPELLNIIQRGAKDAEGNIILKDVAKLRDLVSNIPTKATAKQPSNITDLLSQVRNNIIETEKGPKLFMPLSVRELAELREYMGREVPKTGKNQRKLAELQNILLENIKENGGSKYAEAVGSWRKHMETFHDAGLVSNLLKTKKGGTERMIGVEKVFSKIISQATTNESVARLKNIMESAGPEGKQVWKDFQGTLLTWIEDQATGGRQLDVNGVPEVSYAKLNQVIRDLDKSGKLDLILGEEMAAQIRELRDLSQVLLTAPPRLINTSGTSHAIWTALESTAAFMLTGIPFPAMAIGRAVKKAREDAKRMGIVKEVLGKETVERIQKENKK